MRTLTRSALILLALAPPALAAAESGSKLAIGTIRGDASQVRRQVLLQICGANSCVAASRYTTDDRPDPAKLAAGGVSGYLGGAVTGERGQKRLVLTLTTPSSTAAKPARTWRLKLGADGRLPARTLEQFADELDAILRGEAARKPPAAAAPPPRPPPAKPPPAVKAPPPASASPAPAAQAQAAAAPAPQAAAASKPKAAPTERPSLRGAAEVGLWFTSRTLDYSGVSGGTLRTFEAKGIFVPIARLELYPAAMAGVSSRSLAGLGVRVEYGRSFGLQVEPPAGFTEGTHEATLTTMRLGVLWRVQPMSGSGFALLPSVGYRALQLETSAKDGVEIDGLPDADLSGYEARLDLEAPVGGFTLLAGGGYTKWTSAKELVSDAFFPEGSAHAIEFEAGAQFRITKPLSIRALVVYDSTSYSDLAGGSAYTASGATDKYLGVRATARWEF
jgi:hypothetical protein